MTYTIYSASKLSSVNLKAAISLAESELGAKGTPKLEIDPTLLAGIKIVSGSSLLDLSLSARIDRLTVAIT